jgi:RNA polymerase sigma factor (sigma-70 family)
MQTISTEELVAYFTKRLSSDRARVIEDLSQTDVELAARLWLIQATAGYCREDVLSKGSAAAHVPQTTALGAGNLEHAQEVAAAYPAAQGVPRDREPARELWSRPGSVTALIRGVQEGDHAAAQELFASYFRRLLGLARAKLRGKCLHAADEEDVVQSAFAGFFLGAERGQYAKLHDRDELWHLLAKTTTREAHKLVKEQERHKRSPVTERHGTPSSGSGGTVPKNEALEQVADPHLSPDCEVSANETIEHLLQRLGDLPLRTIAVWKWEGYTTEEIATMLGCSPRTIQRKLQLIRTIWSEEAPTERPIASARTGVSAKLR